jgi:uncharacterized protein YjiS (DUF1127 family)
MFPQPQTRSKSPTLSHRDDQSFPAAQAVRLSSLCPSAIGSTLAGLWSDFHRWRERRHAALLLRELDDHTLRDIGIHRCEIEAVLRSSIRE